MNSNEYQVVIPEYVDHDGCPMGIARALGSFVLRDKAIECMREHRDSEPELLCDGRWSTHLPQELWDNCVHIGNGEYEVWDD